MEREFWHERWRKKEIGFHNQDPNAYLVSNWMELNTRQGSRVFVPLCGKSRDMLWLTEQGHKVLGVELSEIAVREFFDEADIEPEITRKDDLLHFSTSNISIFCGDFFAMRSSQLSGVETVFDRAALIALPAEMRQKYVTRLSKVLPQKVSGLLITMEYNQELMQGPPFSVLPHEVHSLFEGFNDITQLAVDDIEFRAKSVQTRIWQYSRH